MSHKAIPFTKSSMWSRSALIILSCLPLLYFHHTNTTAGHCNPSTLPPRPPSSYPSQLRSFRFCYSLHAHHDRDDALHAHHNRDDARKKTGWRNTNLEVADIIGKIFFFHYLNRRLSSKNSHKRIFSI